MSKDAIFRVIEILDNKHILINYGLQNGAQEGSILRIFEEGEDVIDPKTNTSLGTLDFVKAEVEVVIPYDRFSLCEKIYRTQVNFLDPVSGLMTTRRAVAKLDINNDEATGRKITGNPTISVGDLAHLI